jgi:DNA (cytosine-5)-methyltransferase 1
MTMRVGSLFSGIGGMDLGLERAGMEIVWQVEVDEWCRRVLTRHFPNAVRYGDVRDCHGTAVADAESQRQRSGVQGQRIELAGTTQGRDTAQRGETLAPVDLICGGFPCQPVSHAGRRLGAEDDRWLWPEFHRIIREVRPRWVLVENVPGLLSIDAGRLFGGVLRNLAESGYDAEWDHIPAAALGAPHIRDRVFIVAHASGPDAGCGTGQRQGQEPSDGEPSQLLSDASSGGSQAEAGYVADTKPSQRRPHATGGHDADGDDAGRQEAPGGLEPSGEAMADADAERWDGWSRLFGQGWRGQPTDADWWAVEPDVGRVAHGVPARVDRLRGLGNAVVPQVAEHVGRLIMEGRRG